MNIFFLDRDPVVAAKYHCDKHCVKMCIEYAQLLSTALHITGSIINGDTYKSTHEKHPCTIWVASSLDHWKWLWLLGNALGNEYTRRYNKIHRSTRLLRLLPLPTAIKGSGWTDPPQAMPREFKDKDTVTAYRNFYLYDKVRFAKWNNSEEPWWWK